jgi:predicted  nucleic acid-binding Zn-ribbon protein
MVEVREMAEAHLKNVQQQLAELQSQKVRIEADIEKLGDYLQQGVAELNSEKQELAIDNLGSEPKEIT